MATNKQTNISPQTKHTQKAKTNFAKKTQTKTPNPNQTKTPKPNETPKPNPRGNPKKQKNKKTLATRKPLPSSPFFSPPMRDLLLRLGHSLQGTRPALSSHYPQRGFHVGPKTPFRHAHPLFFRSVPVSLKTVLVPWYSFA